MTGKPQIFKAAGQWSWLCTDHAFIREEVFPPSCARDPWSAAVWSAVSHFELLHAEQEIVSEGDL